MKLQRADRHFEIGQPSLGKAAALAGWSRIRFSDKLGRLPVPVVNLDDEEVQAELRASRGTHHCG